MEKINQYINIVSKFINFVEKLETIYGKNKNKIKNMVIDHTDDNLYKLFIEAVLSVNTGIIDDKWSKKYNLTILKNDLYHLKNIVLPALKQKLQNP